MKKSTVYNIVFKKKNELPTTWEGFCGQNSIKQEEFFIDGCSQIKISNQNTKRLLGRNKNLLSTKEDAEAHLALIQLHRLRDVYRQGWVPDWKNPIQPKFIIKHYANNVNITNVGSTNSFLAFQSEEIAKQFLENFKDLIIKAKELI